MKWLFCQGECDIPGGQAFYFWSKVRSKSIWYMQAVAIFDLSGQISFKETKK